MTRFFYARLLKGLFVGSLLSFVSAPLLAATLLVSDNLIVRELDNKIVEHSFLGQKSTFELSQGEHAINLRYKDVFEDLEIAEDRVVESKNFVVKFTITTEKQLRLTTIEINDLASADKFLKSPKLKLKGEGNKMLEIELETVSDYKLAEQVDIAVNALVAKQSSQNVATSVDLDSSNTSSNSKQLTNNTLIQINSLAMLKYWWQNASDKEKKHFKQYINK